MTATLIKERVPPALKLGPGHLMRVTGSRGGLRYYEDPDSLDQYPSVTTIISNIVRKPGLERWRESLIRKGIDPTKERKTAAKLGTDLHGVLEGLLRGNEEVIVSDEIEPAVEGFLRWRRALPLNFLESEVAVYDKENGYAGTIDAIFSKPHSDELIILDWKSGQTIYPEATIQIAAYNSALKSMGCALNVSGMVVCMHKDKEKGFDGTVEFTYVDQSQAYSAWESILGLYNFSENDIETHTVASNY